MTLCSKAIPAFLSQKWEKLDTYHWHIELYELGLLPTEIWGAWTSVGINWQVFVKYKWNCAHLAANLRTCPYGFYIYNGESPKSVDKRWQRITQAHNFYFTDRKKVGLLPQVCVKNIHTSLATILQVTCRVISWTNSLCILERKSFAS